MSTKKQQYAICFDLDCPNDDAYLITGIVGTDSMSQVALYDTEEEAQREIDDDPIFYNECCVVEYGAPRKLDSMIDILMKHLK